MVQASTNGRISSPKISKEENFAEFITSTPEQLPQNPFVLCGTSGKGITRCEVIEQAKNFAKVLVQNLGLNKGDVVGLVLPNCPEYFSIVIGLILSGIIPTSFNPAFPKDELKEMVEEVGASALICFPSATKTLEALKETSCVKNLIVLDESLQEGAHNQDGNYNYYQLITTGKSLPETKEPNVGRGDDTAMIFWSSGTSGKPKGVELTHSNLITSIITYAHTLNLATDDVVMHPLPFFHIYGFITLLAAIFHARAQVVTMQKFDPKLYIQLLKKIQPTHLGLVPPLVAFIASTVHLEEKDFLKLKVAFLAAAPCGNSLLKAFSLKTAGHVVIREGYGLTETTALGFAVPPELTTISTGSVGTVPLGCEAQVRDPTTGKKLGPGEVGEICLRSPGVMKGYFNRPEATRAMIDEDGWLHTGDLGYFTSEHGLFYITGRIKDVIKVSGFQVSPEEIEDVLKKIPGLADVAVVGVTHETLGEAPRAFVVRRNPELVEEEIHEYLESRVVHYKQLKGGIQFVESIPRSPAGKILRLLLQPSTDKLK